MFLNGGRKAVACTCACAHICTQATLSHLIGTRNSGKRIINANSLTAPLWENGFVPMSYGI